MKIDPYRLEAMKRLHLPTIMMESGVALKASGKESFKGKCPFHEDKNPSLSVGKRGDKWVWNCFGCGEHGNVIDFKMRKEEKSFGEIYAALLPLVGGDVVNGNGQFKERISPPTAPPALSAASSVPASAYLTRAVEIYHGAFCESRPAQDYLAGRGIKEPSLFNHFKVGFADGRLRRMLPEDPGHEFAAGLKAVGVLNAKGGEFFHGCVTFPILDENGGVVGMYGRRAVGEGPAHLYLPGPHKGVWNGASVKAHKDLIVTESIIDALSLCVLGFAGVVPLYGVNGLTEDHVRLMKEHRTRHVLLCLDNDEAGRRARPPIKEKLTALGIEVADFILPSEYKDMNEALAKGLDAEAVASIAALSAVVARTSPSCVEIPGEASPPAAAAASSAPPPVAAPTVDRREEGVYFCFGRRAYRVSGMPSKRREHLRVSLKVEYDGAVHVDHLDLYSAKSRVTYVTCCRRIFEAQEGELHRELNRIIEELEKIQGTLADGETPEGPPPMTEEEGTEAMAALRSPTLYADILRDMETLGYVGEEANKGIGYLVGVSRKLDDPLSCVIISQSSAGKSVLADTVEKMTPPEDVVSLSRATPQAFFYIVKDGLVHKLVIMEERVGAENADYAIRTLQSKKKLSQAVSLKDEATGQIKTKFFEVRGPVAYIETTTKPRINEENATRCFELYLDESAEQTLRIHTMQREGMTLTGLERHGRQDRLIRRHHNMQRLLRSVAVVIPYAPLIEFPTAWLRTRRDHPRFFNLIRVIAFLHQHQREAKRTAEGAEYIEATVDDYRISYGLAKAVMGESFTELKKPQRELLLTMAKMTEGGDVTRREVREKAGLANRRCWELLEDLVDLEYLEKTQGRPGQTCRYRLAANVGAVRGDLDGLTTPEELAAKLLARPDEKPI
jgi:DNA primase catalytic core